MRVVARGVRGEVVARAGPCRASGDWWTSESWGRDEWDVVLNTASSTASTLPTIHRPRGRVP